MVKKIKIEKEGYSMSDIKHLVEDLSYRLKKDDVKTVAKYNDKAKAITYVDAVEIIKFLKHKGKISGLNQEVMKLLPDTKRKAKRYGDTEMKRHELEQLLTLL